MNGPVKQVKAFAADLRGGVSAAVMLGLAALAAAALALIIAVRK
jgi:hypothetical protein